MLLFNPMWIMAVWPFLADLGGAAPADKAPPRLTCETHQCCRATTPSAAAAATPFRFAAFRPFDGAPVAVRVSAGGAAHAEAIAGDPDSVEVIEIEDDQAEGYPPQGGPWLGVQFAPVPEALAAHLGQTTGVLVLNVAEDSPAAAAGLKQYDVVTAMNGQPVGDSVEGLRDSVGKTSVGQAVTLRVIRGGSPVDVRLTIGARPELKDADGRQSLKYLYKTPDWGQTQFEYVNPRMFMMDPQGKLIEPDDDAFKQFHKLIPKLHGKGLKGLKGLARIGGKGQGTTQMTIRQSRDGESISVSRDADGKYTVSRQSKGGAAQTQEYADEAALKAADAEAYKLYSDSVSGGGFQVFGDSAARAFQFHFDEDDMQDVDEAVQDAMKQAEKAMGQAKAFRWHARGHDGVKFQRRADGSIVATTRDADGELVEEFRDENALQRERPELYERYNRMRSLDPDDADDDR